MSDWATNHLKKYPRGTVGKDCRHFRAPSSLVPSTSAWADMTSPEVAKPPSGSVSRAAATAYKQSSQDGAKATNWANSWGLRVRARSRARPPSRTLAGIGTRHMSSDRQSPVECTWENRRAAALTTRPCSEVSVRQVPRCSRHQGSGFVRLKGELKQCLEPFLVVRDFLCQGSSF